jgi:chromosome partitioning protein
MHVLTFASAKGGCGKSTLAIGVAVTAAQSGETVYLVDTDPQRSVMAWGARRKADVPAVDWSPPGALPDSIKALRKAGYTLVVIDTQGADVGGTTTAMSVADLVAIPIRPFILDIDAVQATLEAVARLNKASCVILNGVQPRTSERLNDATAAVGGLIAPSIVSRFVHADAIAAGLAAIEFAPESKAAAEISELWEFLKGKLHERPATRRTNQAA